MDNLSTAQKADTGSVSEPRRQNQFSETPTSRSDDPETQCKRINPFNYKGSFVPAQVSRYKGISPGAKLIYGRLCRYAGNNGQAYPAIGSIAKECGMSQAQARKYIRELETARFIEVDRQNLHYAKNGAGGSFQYYFLEHPAFAGETGSARKTFVCRHSSTPRQKTEPPPLAETGGAGPSENCTRRESSSTNEMKERNSGPTSTREVSKEPADFRNSFPLNNENISAAALNSRHESVRQKARPEDTQLSIKVAIQHAKPSPETEAKKFTANLISLNKANNTAHILNKVGKVFDRALWSERWISYYERLCKTTTSPEQVGGGHYVEEAKQLTQERTTQRLELELLRRSTAATPEVQADIPRCVTCGGGGMIALPDVYCPHCQMGIDISVAEKKRRFRVVKEVDINTPANGLQTTTLEDGEIAQPSAKGGQSSNGQKLHAKD